MHEFIAKHEDKITGMLSGFDRLVTGTHRYQVRSAGRKAITAMLTALRSTVRQLTPVAA